jgi:hypothetical protein
MAAINVVADGKAKDEVDQVTDIKFESEGDGDGNGMLPHHSSEILDSAIVEEIELLLKQELNIRTRGRYAAESRATAARNRHVWRCNRSHSRAYKLKIICLRNRMTKLKYFTGNDYATLM